MKKYFRSDFIIVLALFLAAVLVSVAAYPEVFVNFKTSSVLWNDYNIDYALSFVLTNFIYQGGIQLWDYFGQMPFFHTYAVFGFFKFPNVVTALAYSVLAPFSENSGRLFAHVFVWADLMTLLFIRIIGIFLLLKTVTKNRVILTIGTVIFAVFFDRRQYLDASGGPSSTKRFFRWLYWL